jgi:hypothetical protein
MVVKTEVVDPIIATTKAQAQAQNPLVGHIQYSRNSKQELYQKDYKKI